MSQLLAWWRSTWRRCSLESSAKGTGRDVVFLLSRSLQTPLLPALEENLASAALVSQRFVTPAAITLSETRVVAAVFTLYEIAQLVRLGSPSSLRLHRNRTAGSCQHARTGSGAYASVSIRAIASAAKRPSVARHSTTAGCLDLIWS